MPSPSDAAPNVDSTGVDGSSKLFEPARLGPLTLRNRVIKAATFEGMSPDGVVTDVTVTPESENLTGQQYQSRFAGGIAGEVVGKQLDELKVSKVSGSSLTSGGFNDAVETIKADATA